MNGQDSVLMLKVRSLSDSHWRKALCISMGEKRFSVARKLQEGFSFSSSQWKYQVLFPCKDKRFCLDITSQLDWHNQSWKIFLVYMSCSQVKTLYSQQSEFTFQLRLLHFLSGLIILEYNYLHPRSVHIGSYYNVVYSRYSCFVLGSFSQKNFWDLHGRWIPVLY